MNKIKYIILTLFLAGCVSAGTKESEVFYINDQLVDCVGVAPMKCMQVKSSPTGSWQFFYGHIDGFDYEEGYEYTISVLKTNISQPPADGSSVKYSLIKIINKTKTELSE